MPAFVELSSSPKDLATSALTNAKVSGVRWCHRLSLTRARVVELIAPDDFFVSESDMSEPGFQHAQIFEILSLNYSMLGRASRKLW
jgi:hypothetical protein